jgi:queuosine precursor transporter
LSRNYVHVAVYIISVVIANYFASTLIDLGFISIAVGTLFFGVTFTERDKIHFYLGRKVVYLSIASVVLLSIIENYILDIPSRILLASAIGILSSELTDTQVYQAFIHNSWITRVLASNSISIPIDTLVFTLIAFYGVWPTDVMIKVIIGDIVVKYIVSSLIIWRKQTTAYG